MQLRFLETSQLGLSWMLLYYQENPQLDKDRALQNFDAALEHIKTHHPKKEPFGGFLDVWEQKVAYTAFSILYTIRNDTVLVIDVRDQRGMRSLAALKAFRTELSEKHGV